MQLDNYIKELLYRYECVVLPGFGALLTQYQAARVLKDTNTFHPPGKQLSFNRQLQSNDGLLANHIAKSKNITFQEALDKIRSYTRYLDSKLDEGSTVSIADVGSFKLNSENKIEFIPALAVNYLTESFGLSSFVGSAISREVEADSNKEQEAAPLLFTPRKRQPVYIKYAAVGLIAIALSGFGGIKIYESGVKKHNYVEKQKADQQLEATIQEATFNIVTPLPTLNLEVPKTQGKYHIIAGAFRLEANAHKKVSQLQNSGFNAQLIGVNKYGLHQVTYKTLNDRLEALKTLRDIKANHNKDAWLLVKELDQ